MIGVSRGTWEYKGAWAFLTRSWRSSWRWWQSLKSVNSLTASLVHLHPPTGSSTALAYNKYHPTYWVNDLKSLPTSQFHDFMTLEPHSSQMVEGAIGRCCEDEQIRGSVVCKIIYEQLNWKWGGEHNKLPFLAVLEESSGITTGTQPVHMPPWMIRGDVSLSTKQRLVKLLTAVSHREESP